MKLSRIFLSLSVLALLAIPCSADSTYEVTDFADFLINGQVMDFSYSYQMSIAPDGSVDSVTNVQIFAPNGQWTNESPANTAAIYLLDGPLEFASELGSSCCDGAVVNNYGVYVDQEIIDQNFGSDNIYLPVLGFSWNATPIESQVPEPSVLFTLAVGLLGLAALKLKLA